MIPAKILEPDGTFEYRSIPIPVDVFEKVKNQQLNLNNALEPICIDTIRYKYFRTNSEGCRIYHAENWKLQLVRKAYSYDIRSATFDKVDYLEKEAHKEIQTFLNEHVSMPYVIVDVYNESIGLSQYDYQKTRSLVYVIASES